MKLQLLAVPFVAIFAGAASAADPQLLKLVMPDAKVVSGIDFDKVKSTPFGQFVLSQLPAGHAAFTEFSAKTGFDPLRDLHEIVMASPADTQSRAALMLLRGRFDSQRIMSLIGAADMKPESYRGFKIVSTGHAAHGVSQAFAMLDDSLAVAGDIASVRGVIDRRSSGSGIDAALANNIARISANQDAWLFSNAPLSSFAGVMPEKHVKGALQGDLIKAIEQSSGGIRFGKTIEISGELTARTDQDAASLADVVRFFMNMASMQSPGGGLGQLTTMLQKLTVSTEANAVKLSVSIPEADLETLIKLSSGAVKAPRI